MGWSLGFAIKPIFSPSPPPVMAAGHNYWLRNSKLWNLVFIDNYVPRPAEKPTIVEFDFHLHHLHLLSFTSTCNGSWPQLPLTTFPELWNLVCIGSICIWYYICDCICNGSRPQLPSQLRNSQLRNLVFIISSSSSYSTSSSPVMTAEKLTTFWN